MKYNTLKKHLDLTEASDPNKAPRTCSECGQGMWKGYCINDGEAYYCDENDSACLHKHYSPEEWKRMYDEGIGYYTEWDESDIDDDENSTWIPFSAFKDKVETLLGQKVGIGCNDCTDDDVLISSWKGGESPEEFVNWIIQKYNLTTMD